MKTAIGTIATYLFLILCSSPPAKLAAGGCPDIAAGSFRELKVQDADLPTDCTLIKVLADPGNRAIEVNEANNVGEKSLLRTLPDSRVPVRDLSP